MATISVSGNKKIGTLRKEFNEQFPYLRLGIYYSYMRETVAKGGTITNIDNDKIQNDENKIGHFIIEYEKPKVLSIYVDSSQYNNFTGKKSYRVNLNRLCLIICAVAKGYYDGNKEKFNFFEYELIDKDAQLSSFFCIQ